MAILRGVGEEVHPDGAVFLKQHRVTTTGLHESNLPYRAFASTHIPEFLVGLSM